MKLFTYICSFATALILLTPLANAEPDKMAIIDRMAGVLAETYKSSLKNTPEKPKVIVQTTTESIQDFSNSEINMIIDKLEEKLADEVIILDRKHMGDVATEEMFQQSGAVIDTEVQNLGQKHGANQLILLSFNNQVNPTNKDISKAAFTGKILSLDVSSGRKLLTKTISVPYSHTTSSESYAARDTTSFALGATSVIAGISTLSFGIKMSMDKGKYNDAENAEDAFKWRKETEKSQIITYASAGIGITSLLLKLWLDSQERNEDVYHDYQLTLIPSTNLENTSVGISWNF